MRKFPKPTEQELNEGPQTVSFQIANGNTRQDCILQTNFPTKVQAQKMAQMAHDGYARAISPVHTPGDGDTIFSAATGTWDGQVNYGQIGSLAAEAMADAIVRAATQAASSNNLPAARDLGTIPARFMKK